MCAYKPPVQTSNFQRGPQGAAVVVLSADGKKVKVTFDTGDEYVILRSECPDVLQKGKCFVTLSDKKDKMLSVRPLVGVFQMKVQKFVSEGDKEPAPKTNVAAKWPYQYFIVLLEITSGAWKGAIIPFMAHYNFYEEMQDDKAVVGFSHPKSSSTPPLMEFCDVAGVWNKGPLPYKDNVLPMLAKRISDANITFNAVVKNGYIDSFMPIDSGLESEPLPEE